MRSWLLPSLALLAAAVVPFLAPNAEYALDVLFLIFLYGAMSSAWNIIGGFAGQVSFGHAAFLGIGAYTTAILSLGGWSPYATIPVAGILAALFSLIIGPPCFRLRGPYFSIATIGVSEATRLIALNATKLTGGASGVTLAQAPQIATQYLLALGLCAFAILVCAWIAKSAFGYALAAVKQDTDAAETLGVNTKIAKTQALLISACIVGVAGSVYALHYLYVSPDSVFGFNNGIALIIMPLIGGVGTIWGPLLGAVIFTFIREQLEAKFQNLDLLTFGVLLIAIVLFEPRGLVGVWERLIGWRARARGSGGRPAQARSA